MRSIVESVMKSTIPKETGIDLGKDMFREAFQLHHLTSILKTPYIACNYSFIIILAFLL